jgi:hypothetical protein
MANFPYRNSSCQYWPLVFRRHRYEFKMYLSNLIEMQDCVRLRQIASFQRYSQFMLSYSQSYSGKYETTPRNEIFRIK